MQEIDSRLSFVVDDQAEPVDLDQALAQFLLRHVRSISADPTSPAEIQSQPEVDHQTAIRCSPLEEFCKLTAHLDGGHEFLVGGAPFKCLFAMDGKPTPPDACDSSESVFVTSVAIGILTYVSLFSNRVPAASTVPEGFYKGTFSAVEETEHEVVRIRL